jgi:hypothetical protein
MARAVDQLEIATDGVTGGSGIMERATDDASDGSKSNRGSVGWCERWIS